MRPLLITDCDEVLLAMVRPFAAWVDAAHGLTFRMEDTGFANALKRRECGTPLEAAEVWPLLDHFFRDQMHAQTPFPGAIAAVNRLGADADVVVLTNVGPEHQAARQRQLAALGLDVAVIGSRGSKGPRVAELAADRGTAPVVFVDDLGVHHRAVAADAPPVWRLHMVAEPMIAARIPPEPAAHARIDAWDAAEPWIRGRLAGDPAPATPPPPFTKAPTP